MRKQEKCHLGLDFLRTDGCNPQIRQKADEPKGVPSWTDLPASSFANTDQGTMVGLDGGADN